MRLCWIQEYISVNRITGNTEMYKNRKCAVWMFFFYKLYGRSHCALNNWCNKETVHRDASALSSFEKVTHLNITARLCVFILLIGHNIFISRQVNLWFRCLKEISRCRVLVAFCLLISANLLHFMNEGPCRWQKQFINLSNMQNNCWMHYLIALLLKVPLN